MLKTFVGLLGSKARLTLLVVAGIALLTMLGVGAWEMYSLGKESCQAEALEELEDERERQAEEVDRIRTELEDARALVQQQIRQIQRDTDPCLDSTVPGSVFEALRTETD